MQELGKVHTFLERHEEGVEPDTKEVFVSVRETHSRISVESAKTVQILVIESVMAYCLKLLETKGSEGKHYEKCMRDLTEANALVIGHKLSIQDEDIQPVLLQGARAKLG